MASITQRSLTKLESTYTCHISTRRRGRPPCSSYSNPSDIYCHGSRPTRCSDPNKNERPKCEPWDEYNPAFDTPRVVRIPATAWSRLYDYIFKTAELQCHWVVASWKVRLIQWPNNEKQVNADTQNAFQNIAMHSHGVYERYRQCWLTLDDLTSRASQIWPASRLHRRLFFSWCYLGIVYR